MSKMEFTKEQNERYIKKATDCFEKYIRGLFYGNPDDPPVALPYGKGIARSFREHQESVRDLEVMKKAKPGKTDWYKVKSGTLIWVWGGDFGRELRMLAIFKKYKPENAEANFVVLDPDFPEGEATAWTHAEVHNLSHIAWIEHDGLAVNRKLVWLT